MTECNYLLPLGMNQTEYATDAPTILKIPDHIHLFSECRMSINPTKTPTISQRAGKKKLETTFVSTICMTTI